jgi:ribokinase
LNDWRDTGEQLTTQASIVVVGSVNLDIVARAAKLPVAGETVTDATLSRFPGGKGANQALAAQRLGAQVALHACVGDDAAADEALALLREGGVDLRGCLVDEGTATGTALIAVADSGENQIIVAPGANRCLDADLISLGEADAMLCQLEVPVVTLQKITQRFSGMICMNLAPALPIPNELVARADLVVVNEIEAEFYGDALAGRKGLLAVTRGAAGASLFEDGEVVGESAPPRVDVADTTGAGDTFTAALTVALVEGMDAQVAVEFACTAGALAATRAGAQPSLPVRGEVEGMLELRE